MAAKKEIEEVRRRQILDAAEVVFAKRGIDKARMDDVVEEAGLSKGALYWYFKSKDALIRALLDRVFISEMQEAEELMETDMPASEKLKIFVNHAVREYKRFDKLMPLAYEFVALAARSKAVRQSIVGYFRRYTSLLSNAIQQGIDQGEFKPCDPELVATMVIATYEGMAMIWFIEPELVDWNEVGDEPIEILLSGLKAQVD
jgi:AcrR family transcriptional regulator